MSLSPRDPDLANDNDPDAGNRVIMVRTFVLLPGSTKNATPFWLRQILEFEALEIQPHAVMRGSSCGDYLEPCDAQNAEVWTVNGRYRSGGVEPCEDFATDAEARAFRDRLISAYPHLAAKESWQTPTEGETNDNVAR
jgi:hypothetical protein